MTAQEPVSPDEHLVFSHTIDVLFRKVLAQYVTPEVQARMRQVGIDLSRPLDPAYPLRVFDAAMEVAAVEGMRHLAKSAALHRIGQMQVEAFVHTFIGRASFQFLKLLSHQRFLERMTKSFRQANNFIEASVVEVDPHTFRVRINDVGRFPEVFQGILNAGLFQAGHPNQVLVQTREGLACWYEVRVAPGPRAE